MGTLRTIVKRGAGRGAVAALLLSVAGFCAAAEMVFGAMARQGHIESVDYGANTLVISGTRYTVAIDARVEVAGSYGALTMLQPGMNVAFMYDYYSDKSRVVTQISELPTGVAPLEY